MNLKLANASDLSPEKLIIAQEVMSKIPILELEEKILTYLEVKLKNPTDPPYTVPEIKHLKIVHGWCHYDAKYGGEDERRTFGYYVKYSYLAKGNVVKGYIYFNMFPKNFDLKTLTVEKIINRFERRFSPEEYLLRLKTKRLNKKLRQYGGCG